MAITVPARLRANAMARFHIGTLPLLGYAFPIALLLVGAALRFYDLGWRSFWLDEIFTAQCVALPSLGSVFDWTHGQPDQMPLLYIVVWLLRGFGGSEAVVRFPSALMGSINVLAVYLLAGAIFRRRVAIVAALLFAILPYAVWYGQEARAYAMLMSLTTLQMLFAYRMVASGRPIDAVGLTLCSVLNLYTHYVAILATAAAYAYVAIGSAPAAIRSASSTWRELTAPRVQPPPKRTKKRRKGAAARQPERRRVRLVPPRKLTLALASACVTVLAYLPWIPYLKIFMATPHLPGSQGITWSGAQAYLAIFGITGTLALLLGAGLISAFAQLRGRRWRESCLLLCAFLLPLLMLFAKVQGGIVLIVDRYLSFLLPAAMILAALGLESVAQATVRIMDTLRRRRGARVEASPDDGDDARDEPVPAGTNERWWQALWSRAQLSHGRGAIILAVYALFGALLAAQLVPKLAQSYSVQKDDYRGAALRVMTSRPADVATLAIGPCNDFVARSMSYYMWLHHWRRAVVSAGQVDDSLVQTLQQRRGTVWGAALTRCGLDFSRVKLPPGMTVLHLTWVSLFRFTDPRMTPVQQAFALLSWAHGFESDVQQTLDLLRYDTGELHLGQNLLTAAGNTWKLSPGASVRPRGDRFVISSHGEMENATQSTPDITVGQRYFVSFRYRSGDLRGVQAVYVSVENAKHAAIGVFPSGAGYQCRRSARWRGVGFAFTAPEGASRVTVWLRVTGRGTAQFQHVRLRQL